MSMSVSLCVYTVSPFRSLAHCLFSAFIRLRRRDRPAASCHCCRNNTAAKLCSDVKCISLACARCETAAAKEVAATSCCTSAAVGKAEDIRYVSFDM